ncbi:hypothetical protein [Mangrovibacterium diazotrophicum]|uniref:Secreted protein n=1 Tax=Mangrovibacterium diazotrophicum TaxID=1261403 RepID=A0A419VYA8_9BACT|nr:hypothetical protein [Mangrovibacterium diazotrophicum]RKD88223.1 hypothetical protein BC643_3367 [Mangrovibacterium diazotrophicum]
MKTRLKLLFVIVCFSACFFTGCTDEDDTEGAPIEIPEKDPPKKDSVDGATIQIPQSDSSSTTETDDEGAPIEIPE